MKNGHALIEEWCCTSFRNVFNRRTDCSMFATREIMEVEPDRFNMETNLPIGAHYEGKVSVSSNWKRLEPSEHAKAKTDCI